MNDSKLISPTNSRAWLSENPEPNFPPSMGGNRQDRVRLCQT